MFGNQTLLCQVVLPVRSCAAALRSVGPSAEIFFCPRTPNRIQTFTRPTWIFDFKSIGRAASPRIPYWEVDHWGPDPALHRNSEWLRDRGRTAVSV